VNEKVNTQAHSVRPPTEHFSLGRAMAVCKRVLTQIVRDRRTLGMLFAMPAVVMLIFGFALSGEIKNVPILLDDSDVSYSVQVGLGKNVTLALGDEVSEALRTDDRVKLYTGSFDVNKPKVDDGTYFAVIKIPANFSESAFLKSRGENTSLTIQIYLDATKPAIRGSIMGALQDALQSAMGSQGVVIGQQLAFGGAEYTGLDVSLPSVIGLILTFLLLLVSLMIITRERTGGTLQRLYATPLTALERLVGYSIALLLLGIMMVVVLLVIGVGIFDVVVKGDLLDLFFGAVIYALVHVLMAVSLSNFARNELQAVQLAPLIAFPSMALSGMLVPVNSLPDFVQPFARLIPLYYGNRIFEGIMLKGYGLMQLAPDLMAIIGMAMIFMVLAFATVKDRLED
jgi:ABC-2 type transport system permease protein